MVITMRKGMKIASMAGFVLAIPSLVLVDCFYKGYGVFALFLFGTVGLIFDQLVRLYYPTHEVNSIKKYRMNKRLNLLALVLFVQSPMALVYGNRYMEHFGIWLMLAFICVGIILNQVARIKFRYQTIKEELH